MSIEGLLTLGLFWVLGLLVASFKCHEKSSPLKMSSEYLPGILIFIALITRIIPNLLLPVGAGYDINSYELTAQLLLDGQDVYLAPDAIGRHPYLPLQMLWMKSSYELSIFTGWSFTQIVRLLPIFADSIIAGLVFLIIRETRGNIKLAWQGGIFYALNPITILVTSYHGQFDSIPLLLILFSWMALRGRPTWNKSIKLSVSALILGVAILNKSWPILFLPMILVEIEQWRMKITYSILVALPSVISIFLYAQTFNSDFISVITPAVTYNHGIGIWGYTYITRLGGYLGILPPEIFNFIIQTGRWITLVFMGSVFLIWVRHRAVLKGFLLILLSYYAFTHAFSIQYLSWIIPFAVIHGDRAWLRRYTLAAMIYMILAYFTLILDFRIDRLVPWPEGDLALIIPLSLPLWIVTTIWLIRELKGKKINTFDQQTI